MVAEGERPSLDVLSLPQLEVVSEEDRASDSVFEGSLRGSGRNSSPQEQGGKAAMSTPPLGGGRGSGGDRGGSRGSGGDGGGGGFSRQLSGHHHASFLQRQLSSDELGLKRASPCYMGEEDVQVCEVWVASSNARHATITAIDYSQRFTNIEVRTCMCVCVCVCVYNSYVQ